MSCDAGSELACPASLHAHMFASERGLWPKHGAMGATQRTQSKGCNVDHHVSASRSHVFWFWYEISRTIAAPASIRPPELVHEACITRYVSQYIYIYIYIYIYNSSFQHWLSLTPKGETPHRGQAARTPHARWSCEASRVHNGCLFCTARRLLGSMCIQKHIYSYRL